MMALPGMGLPYRRPVEGNSTGQTTAKSRYCLPNEHGNPDLRLRLSIRRLAHIWVNQLKDSAAHLENGADHVSRP
ncbi:uncharacterized protein METZ01_LOCUS13905 [marine metagenome]|uniref:Uncharacterized protein n=1 Tax=marine metagenome TaxID=408172 RepID=A0A381P2A9_9ZZZZ